MDTKFSDASLFTKNNKKRHIKGRAASIHSECVFLQNKNFFFLRPASYKYQLYVYHTYFLILWEQVFGIYKACPVSVSQMMNTAHWLVCVPSLFCPLIDVLQHSCFKWRVHRTAAFVEGKESAEQT